MTQFVVYTVLVGNYDAIYQPLVVDERFDYVLFTDSCDEEFVGVWKVKKISYYNDDKTRLSRYPKMHPNDLLEGYVASLYIDANIQITSKRIYDRVVECYEQKFDWAGIQHPIRDCIYDEAYAIYGLDTEKNIFQWCHRLRDEKYPRHNGLFENNVIFRAHNQSTKKVNDLWWNMYEKYTRRDQLTLFYVLWKNPNMKITLLLPEGESSCNSNTVQVNKHNSASREFAKRRIKESFWEHTRTRCRNGIQEKVEQFRDFHYWLYGVNPTIAKILLYLWGLYVTIFYGMIIKFRTLKCRKKI